MSWTGQSGALMGDAVNDYDADPSLVRNISRADPPPEYVV
jgi:hypothetical protein